jgi:hypothetical protein
LTTKSKNFVKFENGKNELEKQWKINKTVRVNQPKPHPANDAQLKKYGRISEA